MDLVEWYYNYLIHRDMEFELQGANKTVSNSIGFPQGGVASAKLWILAFNEAMEIINSNGVYGVGFADDCCALVGGTNIGYLIQKLQTVIDKLIQWGEKAGLKFNEQKTVVMHFTKSKAKPRHHIRMNNKIVEFSNECTYLGLKIDTKLSWNTHIDSKINKCKKFLMKTVHETRSNFGPKPKLMKWGFTGLVRPVLTYGAMIWGHAANTACLLYTSPSPRD